MGGVRRTHALLGLAGAVALAGCGGGERQDADEPEGTFPVEVARASFPKTQQIGRTTRMRVAVRNAGEETIRNVALTVNTNGSRGRAPAFGESVSSAGGALADPSRPIWILDEGPHGGETAYVNTWALGRLAPDRTKTFEFRVTPVRRGTYGLSYRVSAGLDGRAKATSPGGGPAGGGFNVRVSGVPAGARAG